MTTALGPGRGPGTKGSRRTPPEPAPADSGRGLAPDDVLAAVGVGGALVAVWPVVLALRLPGPVPLSGLLAHVSGMLAGYGVVVLIGLMSRAPALERGVGADRLSRWHSRGGRAVVLLVLVHAAAAVISWADSRGEDLLLAIWHVLRLPGLIAATVGTLLILAVAVVSVRAARRRVSYERWHAVHLLVYVGVSRSASCISWPGRTSPGTGCCRCSGPCSTHTCSPWCCATASSPRSGRVTAPDAGRRGHPGEP